MEKTQEPKLLLFGAVVTEIPKGQACPPASSRQYWERISQRFFKNFQKTAEYYQQAVALPAILDVNPLTFMNSTFTH